MRMRSAAATSLLCLAACECAVATRVALARALLRTTARCRVRMSDGAWRETEDWALQDAAPKFTVGAGREMCTFWTALAASTPELTTRSASDCEARLRNLTDGGLVGAEPSVLNDWTRLDDGRYTGRVAGESSSVWLTVSLEGKLASDPRPDPGYIEAVGGRVYELGARSRGGGGGDGSVLQPTPAAAAGGMGLATPFPTNIAAAVGATILAGGIGFGIGTTIAPPPPPPMTTTRIFIAPSSRTTPTKQALPSADARPSAPLTMSEQRERAELRVDRDRLKLNNLEQRLKEDEQRLNEYKRMEAERGSDAQAVSKLIFPP